MEKQTSFPKKLFFIVASLVFLGFANTIPQTQAQESLLLGQRHWYSVIFRGNGEAIVYARLVISNNSKQPVRTFSFEIPSGSVSEVVVLQQLLPRSCVQWDFQNGGNRCTLYSDPDYSNKYFYTGTYGVEGQTRYENVQISQTGNRFTVTFAQPIEVNKSGALLLSYAAQGYVSKSLGLYRFSFPTLKVSQRIWEVSVAADVDTDFKLRGKRSAINYGTAALPTSGLARNEGSSNPLLDNIAGQVGSVGPLIKQAQGLAPNETLTVKGEYAASWFALYLGAIVKTVLVIVLIFVGLHYLRRYLKKRAESKPAINPELDTSLQKWSVAALVSPFVASMGLISALTVTGLTYLLTRSDLRYLSSYGSLPPMFGIIITIAVLLLYALLILGPAIYAASKYGWKALLYVLLVQFLWYVILVILYLLLYQTGLVGNQPPPYYGGYSLPLSR